MALSGLRSITFHVARVHANSRSNAADPHAAVAGIRESDGLTLRSEGFVCPVGRTRDAGVENRRDVNTGMARNRSAREVAMAARHRHLGNVEIGELQRRQNISGDDGGDRQPHALRLYAASMMARARLPRARAAWRSPSLTICLQILPKTSASGLANEAVVLTYAAIGGDAAERIFAAIDRSAPRGSAAL